MQAITHRLDLLQSKLSKLVQKVDEKERVINELLKENNKLQTSLMEKEEQINQWKSKVNSVIESAQDEENRTMIKAEIEGYVEQIDDCIALIKAM